ncbi:MAG TPA: thioredoxin domain-containing protein [Arenibaculum sp.]|nr:thioredoxin domain-containing protein [Arenibaculum sp.]
MRRYMLGLAFGVVAVIGVGAALLSTGNGTPPEPEVIAAPKRAAPQPAITPAASVASRPEAPATSPAGVQPADTLPGAVRTAGGQQLAQQAVSPRTTAEMLQDRVLGDPNAPTTIYDYSSLTCPHCAAFHTETLPDLKEQYIDTGKAKLVYRDFPFDAVGLRAAMLARCSPPERYYGFLDVLFRSQQSWSRAEDPMQTLAQTGKLAGVSQQEFDACMDNQELVDGILKRRLEAEQRFQVGSTPSFVIVRGDQQEIVAGNQPLSRFAEIIDRMAQ